MFDSDEAMAQSLRVASHEAADFTKGARYPSLDVMVEIQAGLRKAALEADRRRQQL